MLILSIIIVIVTTRNVLTKTYLLFTIIRDKVLVQLTINGVMNNLLQRAERQK